MNTLELQRRLGDLVRERNTLDSIKTAVPQTYWLLERGKQKTAFKVVVSDQSTYLEISETEAMLREAGVGFPTQEGYYSNSNQSDSHSYRYMNSLVVKKRIKLPIPAHKYPDYNFVGRLLGPRGATLKALERETGCKIMIRGKGSIRKDKESEVRGKPGWEHVFNEPLHVVVEAEMDEASALVALNRAKESIELLLVPVPEEKDSLKRQQLRDLAILNGTFRGGNGSEGFQQSSTESLYSLSPPYDSQVKSESLVFNSNSFNTTPNKSNGSSLKTSEREVSEGATVISKLSNHNTSSDKRISYSSKLDSSSHGAEFSVAKEIDLSNGNVSSIADLAQSNYSKWGFSDKSKSDQMPAFDSEMDLQLSDMIKLDSSMVKYPPCTTWTNYEIPGISFGDELGPEHVFSNSMSSNSLYNNLFSAGEDLSLNGVSKVDGGKDNNQTKS
eukprot:jgi/Galph1/2970/GphlegSOOS_G1629.1